MLQFNNLSMDILNSLIYFLNLLKSVLLIMAALMWAGHTFFWGFVISPYLGRDLHYRCHGLQKVRGRGTPHAVGQGCHTVSSWISVPLHRSYCMVSMVTNYPSLHQLMRRILIYSAFHEILFNGFLRYEAFKDLLKVLKYRKDTDSTLMINTTNI